MGGEPGDLLMFLADTWEVTCKGLYGLRKRLGVELKLYGPDDFHCSWITEFPMFERDEESGRWNAMHHPFTAPLKSDLEKLDSDPAACRAQAYDLVINGSEAGGGTIRIHDSATQSKVFGCSVSTRQMAEDRFGFLLNALKFGAPPHGGIALGDRPLGDALRGIGKHPRSDRVPENAKSVGLDDRSTRCRRRRSADRAAPQDRHAKDVVYCRRALRARYEDVHSLRARRARQHVFSAPL